MKRSTDAILTPHSGRLSNPDTFASVDCGVGGRCYREIGWAKLKSLVEGARLTSKQLWSR